MDAKKTGEFIALLRKERGLTQKQLAEELNVSDKAVSRWETGRGYPDIESLLALSEFFSVSTNELLYGERTDTPAKTQMADRIVANTYIRSSANKRLLSRVSVALVLLFVIVVIVCGVMCVRALYMEVMGTPNCVIAHDYSYLTLFGERYIPLKLDDAECEIGERIISEAQVEGAFFSTKLFFGEQVFAVQGCKQNEIVYLQSDYDFLESEYYCLESKYEEYNNNLDKIPYDRLCTEIEAKNSKYYTLDLNSALSSVIINEDYTRSEQTCDWSRGEGDEGIAIYSYQSNGVFRIKLGELIRKQGEYYWFDYDDIPPNHNNADYSGIFAYAIDNEHDENLDVLFSRMHE